MLWAGDRDPIDGFWTVCVACAAVVALVQQKGAGSDDCSDGDRGRERVDARDSDDQTGACRHHHAVDDRNHPGGRKRELPCARRRCRVCPANDDEVRLELRRDPQVEATKERDAMRVCEVLERGLNQTQERHHPDVRQDQQQNQRERVKRHAEPGHLSDEGQRDQVAR